MESVTDEVLQNDLTGLGEELAGEGKVKGEGSVKVLGLRVGHVEALS